MHNTPLQNAEFAVVWCENNLLWFLSEEPRDPEKIAKCRQQIEEAKQAVADAKAEIAASNAKFLGR